MNAAMPALETRQLNVRFGGVHALDDVSISVPSGAMTGLIGPNGAGKSTLIDAVTGFLPGRATGTVLLGGEDISALAPHRRAHLGLGRTWQSQELFEDITVIENLEIAARQLTMGRAIGSLLRRPTVDPRVAEVMDLLGLSSVAEREPQSLTQRERKLVGVARAVVSRPRLALLDEPAAGLDRVETDWLAERLHRLVESGVPILLVDHDMGLVLEHCTSIIVVDQGRLLTYGTPAEVRSNPDVIRAYLGSSRGERT